MNARSRRVNTNRAERADLILDQSSGKHSRNFRAVRCGAERNGDRAAGHGEVHFLGSKIAFGPHEEGDFAWRAPQSRAQGERRYVLRRNQDRARDIREGALEIRGGVERGQPRAAALFAGFDGVAFPFGIHARALLRMSCSEETEMRDAGLGSVLDNILDALLAQEPSLKQRDADGGRGYKAFFFRRDEYVAVRGPCDCAADLAAATIEEYDLFAGSRAHDVQCVMRLLGGERYLRTGI